MSEPTELENVDDRFAAMREKIHELAQACQYRAATRLASEMRRLARAERRILPYLDANFTVMNHALDLLEPESARDRAIELISLLESEDRARAIEPDLPEEAYAESVAWMTACAYDNLAKATAQLNGYNSDGMHQCISDGILVCRRTGKLQCISCFREYATDVYTAADDLDMALHYAQVGIAHQDGPHDRRWIGGKDLVQLLLLRGDLAAAQDALAQCWNLAETYHTPCQSLLHTSLLQRELSCLSAGRLVENPELAVEPPPAGEFPWYELRRDQVSAAGAACGNDFQQAIGLLQRWDRVLVEQHNLHEWFWHRLRLLAVYRLAGKSRELKGLSEPLRLKAEASRDWLTLRCLERILDDAAAPAPLPLVDSLRAGAVPPLSQVSEELAQAPGRPPLASAAAEDAESKIEPAVQERSLPSERVQQIWASLARCNEVESETDPTEAILADLLAIDPASAVDDAEAHWLVHTARYVVGSGRRGAELWQWAQTLAGPRNRDGTMLSLLATLGSALRFGPNEELVKLIEEPHLEAMFRQSLDLDPAAPRNFGRAGDYYLFLENLGEAERCYARGSRLDRRDGNLANGLANVYLRTDRTRDALAVLDMCLREGCDHPEVAWRAMLTAFQLQQYEATLTYCDRHEDLAPEAAWVNYYRSASLLELSRPAEALAAAEEEGRRNPECPFPVLLLRTSALGMLDSPEFRGSLAEALKVPLREIDYLSPAGLAHLFRRLWLAIASLAPGDVLRVELENLLLASSLAPNELFAEPRKASESSEGINYYEVVLEQPLDERWRLWPGCLAGEQDWQSYQIRWGVLAHDEEEAQRLVQSWQARCFPLPAETQEINLLEQSFNDSAGVVQQGYREGVDDAKDQ